MAKSSTLHPIPPIYRTVHDSTWQAEIGIGLAEYQRPVVRVVNVLYRSHEQVTRLARASGATVEQVRAFLINPERLKLLI